MGESPYPDFTHEDTLINQRLTWLLASQTLLFAGYGVIVSSGKFSAESADQLASPFAWLGKVTAGFLLLGILAAAWAQFHIWWDTNSDENGKLVAKEQRKPYGVRIWTTTCGLTTAIALPVCFLIAWYVLPSATKHHSPAIDAVRSPYALEVETGTTSIRVSDVKHLEESKQAAIAILQAESAPNLSRSQQSPKQDADPNPKQNEANI